MRQLLPKFTGNILDYEIVGMCGQWTIYYRAAPNILINLTPWRPISWQKLDAFFMGAIGAFDDPNGGGD